MLLLANGLLLAQLCVGFGLLFLATFNFAGQLFALGNSVASYETHSHLKIKITLSGRGSWNSIPTLSR